MDLLRYALFLHNDCIEVQDVSEKIKLSSITTFAPSIFAYFHCLFPNKAVGCNVCTAKNFQDSSFQWLNGSHLQYILILFLCCSVVPAS